MIRLATKKDIPAIKHCDSETFEFNYPDDVYKQVIDENLSFVAEVKNTVCGYVMVTLKQTFDTIMTIAVLNAFQGKGIGRALLTRALENLHNVNVTLSVKQDNMPAIKLYKSLGFKIFDSDDFFETFKMIKVNHH